MKRFLLFSYAIFCTLISSAQALFFGPERLSSTLITSVVQSSDGLIWVGTSNGLSRFDGYRFTQTNAFDELGRPFEVSELFSDQSGNLWVGTARALLLHDHATDQMLPVAFPDSIEPRITKLSSTSDGKLLVGTAGYGYFIVDPATLQAQPRNGAIPSGEEAFIKDQKVQPRLFAMAPEGVQLTCSVQDNSGNIYIGTRGSGLFWIPAGMSEMQRKQVFVSGIDLDRARIETLFIDRLGNLWVGCQQKGLLMIPLHRMPLFNTWSFSEQKQELGTCVSAIASRAANGNQAATQIIWCAVQGDGIYGFDENGKIVAHPASPTDVETLVCDSDGNFWLGTNGSLWSYDPESGQARFKARLGGERVNVIREIDKERLAVSVFGEGLFIVEKASGTVLRHLSMNSTDTVGRGRLANDWIFCLDTDSRGCLWIATSAGVCCYDVKRGSFKSKGWSVLVENEQCEALCVTESDEVFIASERGLMRWNSEQGLQPEKGSDLLRGKGVAFMAEDSEGDLWLSTNEGIWLWNPTEKIFVEYVGAFGLKEREFVQGAGLQTPDGRIYFGTSDGITSFSPEKLRNQLREASTVHLTSFVIAGETANAQTRSNGKLVMDGPVSECHRFNLSYVDAVFRLEFSLLDFATAEGVSFEYRMNGENVWQQTAQGENSITFSHLAPGTYNLEVRAIAGGVYTPSETWVIEVRPPWWRTTFAHCLYVLLFIAGAIAVAVAYRRYIQHQLDREKLHFLMSAINTKDTPLTLDDMKRAINSFVQSRKRQRSIYGNSAEMADQMDMPTVQGNDEALMERVVQSVNRHLGDSDFSVEQLCEEAAISRAHLHRKMKEMTGLSVTEFIRNIRMEQAARLLREQKLNITQVAYTVGFSNLGYFSTIFRKHFGVSPRSFVSDAPLPPEGED